MDPQQGFAAERWFLRALTNLGFVETETTDSSIPNTVRKASAREDSVDKVDFLLTVPHDGEVAIVPLQLTLRNTNWSGDLQKKLRQVRNRKVALFWPVPEIGQERAIRILRKAALGAIEALHIFEELLAKTLQRFFRGLSVVLNPRLEIFGGSMTGRKCLQAHSGATIAVLWDGSRKLQRWVSCYECGGGKESSARFPYTLRRALMLMDIQVFRTIS